MAIEIKAIPTLEGKDAERFIERADEAERKFKGFDGIENTPAFKAMQSILRKSGMTKLWDFLTSTVCFMSLMTRKLLPVSHFIAGITIWMIFSMRMYHVDYVLI